MIGLFEAFRDANIPVSKAKDTNAEQLTGLLTLAFFLHSYSQKMMANEVDINALAWLAINLLSVGLLVYYLLSRIQNHHIEQYITKFWRFSRVLLVNYVMAILVLCTGREKGVYPWFKLAQSYDINRPVVSVFCSLVPTLLLMYYSWHTVLERDEKSKLWSSGFILLAMTSFLMTVTYSY
ncbi:hypothetical protein D0814_23760 [Vibrio parahaemolyticus]|nr:hypothetical protein [Vibrio parahaemolyticus]EHH1260231.1 hypothetical protein [Vibrio parahaemolyticus]